MFLPVLAKRADRAFLFAQGQFHFLVQTHHVSVPARAKCLQRLPRKIG